MKAYWIAVYKDLENIEKIKKYAEKASPAIVKYKGKILSRGGEAETIEGSPSPRTVLIEFPSKENALNFYHSSEYQAAMKLGGKFNRDIQIVEAT
tara:strand:- start:348 stop:632 length:285 start_codon:yes stop_codon:yes gene_type:complete